MPNNAHYKQLKELCRSVYLGGETDVKKLAERFNVKRETVWNWIRKGQWEKEQNEARNLEENIRHERNKAYLNALRAYNENPSDTNLQSVVGLLKQAQQADAPDKALRENILRLLDQVTDFYIEKGDEKKLEAFQEDVLELAEYLKRRNHG